MGQDFSTIPVYPESHGVRDFTSREHVEVVGPPVNTAPPMIIDLDDGEPEQIPNFRSMRRPFIQSSWRARLPPSAAPNPRPLADVALDMGIDIHDLPRNVTVDAVVRAFQYDLAQADVGPRASSVLQHVDFHKNPSVPPKDPEQIKMAADLKSVRESLQELIDSEEYTKRDADLFLAVIHMSESLEEDWNKLHEREKRIKEATETAENKPNRDRTMIASMDRMMLWKEERHQEKIGSLPFRNIDWHVNDAKERNDRLTCRVHEVESIIRKCEEESRELKAQLRAH